MEDFTVEDNGERGVSYSCDTIGTVTIQMGGKYQAKISSTSYPNVVAGTSGVVTTKLESQSGNDYFFSFTGVAVGDVGIYINGEARQFVCHVVGATGHTISMPSGRQCNWNQFCSSVTSALGGSTAGCSITCGLDIANFYGPNSYTMQDLSGFWGGGNYSWELPISCAGIIDGFTHVGDSNANMFSAIRAQIDTNRPVIIELVNGTALHDTHFVVAYGYKSGGTSTSNILVFDPALNGSTSNSGLATNLAKSISDNGKTRMYKLKFTHLK